MRTKHHSPSHVDHTTRGLQAARSVLRSVFDAFALEPALAPDSAPGLADVAWLADDVLGGAITGRKLGATLDDVTHKPVGAEDAGTFAGGAIHFITGLSRLERGYRLRPRK